MDRLIELALSPFDEAYKSLCGHPGASDKPPTPVDRTLYVAHVIEEHMAVAFDSLMRDLCSGEDTEDIAVVLNTPGGQCWDGLAMYDAVSAANESGNHVLTVVRGKALSMGGVLLQAGHTRKMTANSYLMIHQSWGGIYQEANLSQAEREMTHWRDLQNRLNRLLSARSTMTAKEVSARIQAGDWYLNAKEALKLGFVDEVI